MTRRTNIPHEVLWSCVEGRLEARTADAVARYVEQHPDLLKSIRIMQKQQATLEAVDPRVLDESVPERLTDVIERARRRLREHGNMDHDSDGNGE